ncbi:MULTISPECIES: ABC transporter permease [unclassified Coleofasciculus]|uniref:ABC transporter permease n=1 Tax=unclassified Coleofasciculus TaxID=2692782 RepID=UPI001882274E|nr:MULTISPECIES: ABC transporter permease [unclassified Coleofasciculus]MBE9126277.1 ABC transporter permease [Coleofasciculus sp. LEGE 07081]MBE9149196.1 ABC transporter permease [Coleofasciculus sp. LEGE 07092]
MTLNLINQLGEWNPQLFRELKGRLKPRNILVSVAISFLGQLFLLMAFASRLPVTENPHPLHNRYCTGFSQEYSRPGCIADKLGGFEINWQLWWQDVFVWLSLIGIFALLVVGTYMLIADFSKEEHRGTLNFLRLTPGSTPSILGGKLLGVPILLYLVAALALPLHLLSDLSGNIPLSQILGFYGVLGASCLFFYSAALLFGLVGNWLAGFQAWLGSGAVLIFLFATTDQLKYSGNFNSPSDWLMLFNPGSLLPYLIDSHSLDPANSSYSHGASFVELLWFYLPIGARIGTIAGFTIVNYGLWTYWIWQGLNRCFHNPNATLLSKSQSYRLTACFEGVLLGFAVNPTVTDWRSDPKGLFENFAAMLVFNLLLFLGLIAALSPHRQAIQDWARYRHQNRSSRLRKVIPDLIWGRTSPAPVAVVLNLAIASIFLLLWIMLSSPREYTILALVGLLLSFSLIALYATITQLMLLMKTPKRAIWAAVTISGLIILPPIAFGFLSISPSREPAVWLFSAFPWASVEYAAGTSVLVALIGQSLAVALLNLQLTRQLRQAGESSTKALLSRRSPSP